MFPWDATVQQICELADSFILNQVGPVIRKNGIGLYWVLDLRIFCGILKPIIEIKKKEIVKIVKKCGLSIKLEFNLKTFHFLDILFDLQNNIYKPCNKANEKATFINKKSSDVHVF